MPRDRRSDLANLRRGPDMHPVFDNPSAPAKYQEENNEYQQCIQGVDLGDRRIRPKRAGKRHEQPRADSGRGQDKVRFARLLDFLTLL